MPIKKPLLMSIKITNKRVTVMHPFKAKMNLKCVSDQPNNKS